MKKALAIIISAIFCIMMVSSVFASDDHGPAEITIEFVKDKKPAVHFEHKKHQDDRKIDCKTCHHKAEDGKKPQGCSKCHGKKKDGDKPAAKDAFHKNCKDNCHKAKKKGPTKCNDCHKK